MEVLKAKIMGYCVGVENAIKKTKEALLEHKNEKVYSLGPLIHNEVALSELEKLGLAIIDFHNGSISDIESILPDSQSVVVIRAHGISPKIREMLEKGGYSLIDATCPKVLVSQKIAREYSERGYQILFAGDKNHAEVQAIHGFAGGSFTLIQNETEALSFIESEKEKPSFKNNRYVLFSQTTFSEVKFKSIEKTFRSCISNLKVINTICSSTRHRQESLLELINKVDGVLIIGDRNSSNTRRLFEIALEHTPNAKLIESASEIGREFLSLKKVGVTAGASTPNSVISEVEQFLTSRK